MNESFQIEQNTIENPNENNKMEKMPNIAHSEKNGKDIIKM
jgi:hypothetical protein